jgi:2-polyprenyl-3-methyl-5-hydroxy-6-metoxy-1,4-benzoquinol methylase
LGESGLTHIPCNVCDSSDSENLYEIAGYSIVKCKKCDLVFVSNQPTSEELKKFYNERFHSEEWYNKFPQLGNFNYFSKTNREKEGFASYINDIKKYKSTGKIIDIGCGDGWLLKHAMDFGFDVYGVEPSINAFKEAKKRLDENIFNSVLEDMCFDSNFFDIAISIGTIEHIKKPFLLLNEINRILKKDGLLVLQTPNIDSYLAKHQKAKWDQFTPPGHLYYFSPKTLKRLLEKAGFKILKFDMKIPLFAPMDYGAVRESIDPEKTEQIARIPNKIKDFVFRVLKPFKPVLIPVYDSLCQLKGQIIGKHDITVYTKKVG